MVTHAASGGGSSGGAPEAMRHPRGSSRASIPWPGLQAPPCTGVAAALTFAFVQRCQRIVQLLERGVGFVSRARGRGLERGRKRGRDERVDVPPPIVVRHQLGHRLLSHAAVCGARAAEHGRRRHGRLEARVSAVQGGRVTASKRNAAARQLAVAARCTPVCISMVSRLLSPIQQCTAAAGSRDGCACTAAGGRQAGGSSGGGAPRLRRSEGSRAGGHSSASDSRCAWACCCPP